MKLKLFRDYIDYLIAEVGPDVNVVLNDTFEGYDFLQPEDVNIVEAEDDYEKGEYGEKYILIQVHVE